MKILPQQIQIKGFYYLLTPGLESGMHTKRRKNQLPEDITVISKRKERAVIEAFAAHHQKKLAAFTLPPNREPRFWLETYLDFYQKS
ncbi:MAG: hypothetical protein H7Z13_07545 [Ferruginibacter sp.]|nr:hypothetical protein [Ferruginibacter sp.]